MVWVLGQKLQDQEAQLLDLEGGKEGMEERKGGGKEGKQKEGGEERGGERGEGRGGREKGGVEGGERNDCEAPPHGCMKLADGIPVCCQGKHSCR